MKYLILLISIVALSSCSNDVGRYQPMNKVGTLMIDTKTGDIYLYHAQNIKKYMDATQEEEREIVKLLKVAEID